MFTHFAVLASYANFDSVNAYVAHTLTPRVLFLIFLIIFICFLI